MPIKLPPNCWDPVQALVRNLSDPEATEADNTNCFLHPKGFLGEDKIHLDKKKMI